MAALSAHVVNGQIVLDEPADLPEGARLDVFVDAGGPETWPEAERAKLDTMITESAAQFERGEFVDEDEILDELYGP